MATKQQMPQVEQQPPLVEQKRDWRLKTARDHLPKSGFSYRKGTVVFMDGKDSAAFKIAIANATDNMSDRTLVDERLAELFEKAKELRRESMFNNDVYEKVGKAVPWTSHLDKKIVIELMNFLHAGRALYVKFTHYRSNVIGGITDGKLAKAIDNFRGEYPAKEPDEVYKDMPKEMIDKMISRILNRQKADWDACSSYNGSDNEDVEMKEPGAATTTGGELEEKMSKMALKKK
ncbi:hypothetical protein F4780DRAFT_796158 [Xylariomycetidae sp. FL0641]|nr:hypothetical protein F4780DRAFT_796158 [Xylariomycetidae sp. FL0641]